MASIDDVARAAGVSTATVSRALSGRGPVSAPTRDRVSRAAAELGYVVSADASSLASGRTRSVGVILPYVGRWFYTQVLDGAQTALTGYGYDLTLYNLGGGAAERRSVFEHFLFRKRVDAVIAVSLEITAAEVERIHAIGKPTVCVGGPIPGLHTLSIDDHAVSRLATRHLIELGHTRIGHIQGGPGDHDFHLPKRRRDGWAAALRSAGLPRGAALVRTGDFSMASGRRAGLELLADPATRPTAVFAASDEMAIGVLLAARDLGLDVPGDLSVIGIDDHELAETFGLSTVAQHPVAQGRRAVEVLMGELGVLDPVEGHGDIPLPFELLARASTAPPRAG